MVPQREKAIREQLFGGRLQQAGEMLILREFSQFIVSHPYSQTRGGTPQRFIVQISPIPFRPSARARTESDQMPYSTGCRSVRYGTTSEAEAS